MHTIRKVVIAPRVVTTLAGVAGMAGSADGTGTAARFSFPRGVAVDGAGKLYVADSANQTIRQIGLANGDMTTLVGVRGRSGVQPGPLPASLSQPYGIAASPAGLLYLTDFTENAVLEVR